MTHREEIEAAKKKLHAKLPVMPWDDAQRATLIARFHSLRPSFEREALRELIEASAPSRARPPIMRRLRDAHLQHLKAEEIAIAKKKLRAELPAMPWSETLRAELHARWPAEPKEPTAEDYALRQLLGEDVTLAQSPQGVAQVLTEPPR